jgi:hypothetical protein
MNKKGFPLEDAGMFFLCFLIIIVPLVIGISIFFIYQADVRGVEAQLLGEKVLGALIDENGLRPIVLSDTFNLLKEAHLDSAVISGGNFFVMAEIYEEDDLLKRYKEGPRDFEVYCELKGEKLPACFRKEIFIDVYKINILTASNQR